MPLWKYGARAAAAAVPMSNRRWFVLVPLRAES
jgi:hypothetical protein